MPAIEVGRVVVKIAGREAGRKAVIVDIIDDKFVVITGPKQLTGVKTRRVNVNHIEPTDKRIDISKGASEEEVMKAIEDAGLVDFMKQRARIGRREILQVKAQRA